MPLGDESAPFVDHVAGTFARSSLSGALAEMHRAGFGPHTRVLDGARGDAAGQLERTGLRIVEGEAPAPDAVLILVTAPGRAALVANLFARLGAESILLAARQMPERPTPRREALEAPDLQIGVEQGVGPEA